MMGSVTGKSMDGGPDDDHIVPQVSAAASAEALPNHEDTSAGDAETPSVSSMMLGVKYLTDFIAGVSNSVDDNNPNFKLPNNDEDGVAFDDYDYDDDVSDYDDDFFYDDEDDVQAQLDNAKLVQISLASTSSGPNHADTAGKRSHSSNTKRDVETERKDVMERFKNFKQFDVVDEFPDHEYSLTGSSGKNPQPAKNWAKTIQDEWKILEQNLPDTIFVRVCESRMELMRAVIIGPSGTPYHDGLFFFDCLFPPTYPEAPPTIHYHSGGLRLNPNLYECGKVCLSLLGTWRGESKTEMWIPGTSTMLQVLVSIQALVLNEEPFYNEPGYETDYTGAIGEKKSNRYSEKAFLLSLKTMVYTLRRPPKHFEDFVAGHFRERANDILAACRAYKDGAKVGSVAVKDGVADLDKAPKTATPAFITDLGKMMDVLVKAFNQFRCIEPVVSCQQP